MSAATDVAYAVYMCTGEVVIGRGGAGEGGYGGRYLVGTYVGRKARERAGWMGVGSGIGGLRCGSGVR